MIQEPVREARIDLGAIARNVQALRSTIATEHTMAVVKANGYGHGAVQVSRAVLEAGADWLGVADINEALELRAAGISAPILAWLHHPYADFSDAISAGVDIGVSHIAQLEQVVAATPRSAVAQVQIKVDTGLGRNGAAVAEWEQLFTAAAERERRGEVRIRGLFSHLANASHDEDAGQVALFEQAIEGAAALGLTPDLLHLAATAGAIAEPETRFNMVRLGIGLYGLSPYSDQSVGVPLTPAMELGARIVAVNQGPAGTSVVIPLGYAHGLPRRGWSGAQVAVNGTLYSLREPIGFDRFTLELGDDVAWVGDRAVLFGDPASGAPTVDDWAASAGTINYEIVTHLGPAVERSYR